MKSAPKLIIILAILMMSLTAGVFAQDDIEIPEPGASVTLDETVTGEISDADPIVVFEFEGTAGLLLSIQAEYEDVDGYLFLADADGNVLAANDDADSTRESAIPAFMLMEDGIYRIAVSTYTYVYDMYDGEAGTFELTVTEATADVIEIGDVVEGEVDDQASADYFLLDTTVGQILTISLASDDFDAELTLDPVQGQDVEQRWSDDYGFDTNSQIGPFLVTEGGAYLITASSYYGMQYGSYTLQVTATEPEALEGASVQGELTMEASSRYYTLELEAGDELELTLTAGETTQMMVELYNEDGTTFAVGNNVDDGQWTLEFIVEDAGTYYVGVVPSMYFFTSEQLGDYELNVSIR